MENRRFVPRLVGLLIGSLLLAPMPRAVAETAGKLADHLPGYSIARCLFPEGRLVLEHEGEFLVLRKGDTLPGMPRMKVLQLDAEGALLAEAAASQAETTNPAVPERMIKITQDPTGSIEITLLTAQPPDNEYADLLEAGTTLVIDADGQPVIEPASGAPTSGVPAIRPTRDPSSEGSEDTTDAPTPEDLDGQP